MLNSIASPSILPCKPLLKPLLLQGSSSLLQTAWNQSHMQASLLYPVTSLQLCLPVPAVFGVWGHWTLEDIVRSNFILGHSCGSRDRRNDVITVDVPHLFFLNESLLQTRGCFFSTTQCSVRWMGETKFPFYRWPTWDLLKSQCSDVAGRGGKLRFPPLLFSQDCVGLGQLWQHCTWIMIPRSWASKQLEEARKASCESTSSVRTQAQTCTRGPTHDVFRPGFCDYCSTVTMDLVLWILILFKEWKSMFEVSITRGIN